MIKRLVKDGWQMLWPLLCAATLSILLHSYWPVIAVLSLSLMGQIWQKWRLARWLEQGKLLEPPHASGLWEDYYTRLMHLFRREQKAQQELWSILDRARHCADALNEGVLLLNRKGEIEYSNQAAFTLLDMKGGDKGEVLVKLLRNPDFRDYLEKRVFIQPLVLHAPIGERFLQYRATDLGQQEILLRVEDVSHVHALETLRRDFVGNVSHELKTPLTVFKGYLELLQDLFEGSGQPNIIDALKHMDSQCLRMEALVKDLLLLAQLESTKVKPFKAIDISAVVETVWSNFRHEAERKSQNVSFLIEGGIKIRGVQSELESAFGNLLGNAIKYTPNGRNIQVKAWKKGVFTYFEVADDGEGIEAKHVPHLTERFYRVDESRSTENGGTGLGLSIVKHVLQRHSAKLKIESEVKKGSQFTCVFPSEEDSE